MNEYIPFTDEQKRRANAMDLEDYLLRRGERHRNFVDSFGQRYFQLHRSDQS